MKYNDPTGESPALAVAIPAAGKTVGAVAMSIGPVGWVVIGAVAVVGVGIVVYNHYANSADKENEQAKAVAKEEGNRSFGSITIQIQKGTKSIQKGSTRLALNEKGVTKQEAQELCANRLTYYQIYGKMVKSKTFQEAVMKMSKNIQTKTTTGTCDQKQMRVWFNYNGQNYRIDMFNKGDNLKY